MINVGIIGFGVVGKRRKKYIIENKFYNLSCISDISFNQDYKTKNIDFYKSYKKFIKHDLDAVFITLPNYLAVKVTSFFLKIERAKLLICLHSNAKKYSTHTNVCWSTCYKFYTRSHYFPSDDKLPPVYSLIQTLLPPVVYYSRVTDTVMHSTAKETMYSFMIQWLFK